LVGLGRGLGFRKPSPGALSTEPLDLFTVRRAWGLGFLIRVYKYGKTEIESRGGREGRKGKKCSK
jgi:hypothetical protein